MTLPRIAESSLKKYFAKNDSFFLDDIVIGLATDIMVGFEIWIFLDGKYVGFNLIFLSAADGSYNNFSLGTVIR